MWIQAIFGHAVHDANILHFSTEFRRYWSVTGSSEHPHGNPQMLHADRMNVPQPPIYEENGEPASVFAIAKARLKRPLINLIGERFKQSTVFFKLTEEIEEIEESDFICDLNDKAHVNAVRTCIQARLQFFLKVA